MKPVNNNLVITITPTKFKHDKDIHPSFVGMTDAIARTGPTETVPPAAAAAVLSPAASSYMMATHPSSLPDVGHPPLPPVAPSSQQVVMPSPVRMAANSPIVVPLALRSPHASSPHISPQLAHLHGGAQPNLSMMPAAAADVISQSMSSQTLQSSNKRSRPPALNMTLIPPGERDSSGKGSKGSARSTKRARNKRHSSSNSLSVPRLSPTNSSPHLTPTMGSSPQTYGYPYMMQSHNGMHYMMPLSPLGISSPGGGATPAAMLPPAYAQQGARLMAPAQQAGAYMPYQYAYQMYPGPGHGPLSVGQVLENSNYPGPSDPTVAMSASLRELKQQADEREKQFAQHAGKHVSHGSDGSSNSTDQSGDNNASISQAVSAAASAISSDTRAQSAAVAAAAARNRSRPDVALNGPVPHMSYQYQYPHMYASMSAYPTGIAHYAGMSPTDDDTDRRMITYDGLDKGTKRPGVALGPMGSAKRGKVMRGGDIDPVAGVLPPQGRRRVVTNRKPKAKKKPTKKKPPKKATSTPKKATATPKKATTPKKKASKKATAAMTKISIVPAAAGEEPKADPKPKADSPAIDMQAPLSQRRATVPAQKPVPKKKPVAAAKAKKASTPKLKQSGGRKKPTGVRETVCVGLAPDHPAVLAAGIKPNPAVLDSGGGANRIFKLHEDFFGREVEVFVALDDPTRTVLFKAVDLAAELNRPKNMLSMYLSRKKKKPNSGIVQAGKILYKQSPRLDLKRGCYFMTREALQRFKEHCAKKA